jgi:hypothetical protein
MTAPVLAFPEYMPATFDLDLEATCVYRYVDRWPHHFRVQGSRWESDHPAGCRDRWIDLAADTAEQAAQLKAAAESQGYAYVSVLAPRCPGGH